MGSRWYTPHLNIVAIIISPFIPPWYQGFNPGVEENDVKCLSVMRQLASRRRLLQIPFQPGAS